jgi:AraC-like DNA-binding protein
MVVELHPNAPGPVGPLVRTLTRRFPGVPLVVACTERTPDGREVLGAAHAGAELFSFPPDDDLAALVARLVGDGGGPPEAASVAASLPRTAQRILAILMSKEPPPPETIEELADRLPMSVRTLQRRMTRHAWPAPGALLMWGRLLRGASAAEEARNGKRPFSTTELAHASGFQTVHGAAAMYRGYAEVTLQAVLSAGVSALEDALLDAFPLPGARD